MSFGFDQDDDDSQANRSSGYSHSSPIVEAIDLAIDEPAAGLVAGGIMLGVGVALAMASAAVGFSIGLSVGGTVGGVGVLMCGGALVADVCNGLKAGVEFIARKMQGHRAKAADGNSPRMPDLSQAPRISTVAATRAGSLKAAFAGRTAGKHKPAGVKARAALTPANA